MKILQVNKFFYPRGGSEYVFFDTVRLLEKNGHDISFFSMQRPDNLPSRYQEYFISAVNYEDAGIKDKLLAGLKILYSLEARKKIEKLIGKERPDIAHLNNIYHQISPSILHSLKRAGVPIVMTLHDFKMACASYYMLAKGEVCQACKNREYYHCFLNCCMKNSLAKSLLGTLEMYLHHRIMRIYELVDIFIAPSRFLQSKLKEMGFNGKVIYLPNFVEAEEFSPQYHWQENSLVYFGRLAPEKGLLTLLEAIKKIGGVTLKIIGCGPMSNILQEKVRKERIANVFFLGYKPQAELRQEVQKSICVIFPSQCLENNPRAVIEAFALGKPVIGSDIGGVPELISDNQTGLLFQPGNPHDLAQKIKLLLGQPEKIKAMGMQARRFIEQDLNSEKYYRGLLEIYEKALNHRN